MIYSKLSNFHGILIVGESHVYSIIRNPLNFNEWIQKDSLCETPESIAIHELLLKCSDSAAYYILDNNDTEHKSGEIVNYRTKYLQDFIMLKQTRPDYQDDYARRKGIELFLRRTSTASFFDWLRNALKVPKYNITKDELATFKKTSTFLKRILRTSVSLWFYI